MGVDHKHLTGKAALAYRDSGLYVFYTEDEVRRANLVNAQERAAIDKPSPDRVDGRS